MLKSQTARNVAAHRGGLLASVLLAFALLASGCSGKSKTPDKTDNRKTTPTVERPAIATRPLNDVLEEAVRMQGGNVEAALDSLVPAAERDSYIVRNAAGRIEAIDLSRMSLTTAGVKHLLALKDSLQRVALNRVYVTDEALAALATLPHLKKLELNWTPITDAGLSHLQKAAQLRELSLTGTNVKDNGLKHLSELKELRFLSLSWTGVTDAGLKHLAGLSKLNTLILNNTAVGDDGLMHLAGLKNLLFLHVTETHATANGVAALRKSLPRLDVRGA